MHGLVNLPGGIGLCVPAERDLSRRGDARRQNLRSAHLRMELRLLHQPKRDGKARLAGKRHSDESH